MRFTPEEAVQSLVWALTASKATPDRARWQHTYHWSDDETVRAWALANSEIARAKGEIAALRSREEQADG